MNDELLKRLQKIDGALMDNIAVICICAFNCCYLNTIASVITKFYAHANIFTNNCVLHS